MLPEETRKCTGCGDIKPLTEYHKNGPRLHPQCKACRRELRKTRYYQNVEDNRANSRKWRDENTERSNNRVKEWRKFNLERKRELSRKWYQDNKEKVRERTRELVTLNPDLYRARKRREYRNNLERAQIHGCLRHCRKHQVAPNLTTQEWREMKESYFNQCVYCGRECQLGIDHVFPLSWNKARPDMQGLVTHDVNNVVPACFMCNAAKSDYSLLIFLGWKNNMLA